jgi:hypothetical protein
MGHRARHRSRPRQFFRVIEIERAWIDPTSEGTRSIRRVRQRDDFVTTIKQMFGEVLPRVPESTRHSM